MILGIGFPLHSFLYESDPTLSLPQFRKNVLCVTGQDNWFILKPEAQNQTGN